MKNVKLTKVALMVLLLMLCVPTESVYAQSNNTQEIASKLVDGLFGKNKKKKDKKKDNEEKETTETTGSVIGNTTKEKDDIELVVWGNGANKEEATKVALRSAIEQTFGVFVSSNTEILNDELVKDEIATISSGNIKSYEYIAENVINGMTEVNIKAIVSIGKLITFAKSKGSSAELAGATFAMNVKMSQLNLSNQEIALKNLYQQCVSMLPYMYSYEIVVQDPQSKGSSEKFEVNYEVIIKPNENAKKCREVFEETYRALAVPESVRQSEQQYSSFQRAFLGLWIRVPQSGKTAGGLEYWLDTWKNMANKEICNFQVSDMNSVCKFYFKDGKVGCDGKHKVQKYTISEGSIPSYSKNYTISVVAEYTLDEISKITGFNVSRIE